MNTPNTFYDTFTLKLEGKEKLISSLEEALARKPNAKLSKRLSKEREEVERIKQHLERVKAYAA